jgi:hypothetical protein
MQEKATLHLHDDVGKPFRISSKLRRFGQRCFQFHRGKTKGCDQGVNGWHGI